jgi:hypothetical protein
MNKVKYSYLKFKDIIMEELEKNMIHQEECTQEQTLHQQYHKQIPSGENG